MKPKLKIILIVLGVILFLAITPILSAFDVEVESWMYFIQGGLIVAFLVVFFIFRFSKKKIESEIKKQKITSKQAEKLARETYLEDYHDQPILDTVNTKTIGSKETKAPVFVTFFESLWRTGVWIHYFIDSLNPSNMTKFIDSVRKMTVKDMQIEANDLTSYPKEEEIIEEERTDFATGQEYKRKHTKPVAEKKEEKEKKDL